MISAYIYCGLTIPHRRQAIKAMNPDQNEKAHLIISAVCNHFALMPAEIKTQVRKREFVMARQICCYFIKEFTNMHLKAIGDLFDGRDHSTVIYAINTVNDLKDTDRRFARTLTEIEHLLDSIPKDDKRKKIPEIPTVGSN